MRDHRYSTTYEHATKLTNKIKYSNGRDAARRVEPVAPLQDILHLVRLVVLGGVHDAVLGDIALKHVVDILIDLCLPPSP